MTTSGDAPDVAGARPWPAPSPESDWWQGDLTDLADEPLPTIAASPRSSSESGGTRTDLGPYAEPPRKATTAPITDPTNRRTDDRRTDDRRTDDRRTDNRIATDRPMIEQPWLERVPPHPRSVPTPVEWIPQDETGPEPPSGQPTALAPSARASAATHPTAKTGRRTSKSAAPQRGINRRRGLAGHPCLAVPALLLVAAGTTFVAWVSAEPFWLALGHGQFGTATVRTGECQASFVTADGRRSPDVALTGAPCSVGASVAAGVVSDRSTKAYPTEGGGLLLRSGVGWAVVGLSGLMTGWITGVSRLRRWRRVLGWSVSLTLPTAVMIVMLVLTH